MKKNMKKILGVTLAACMAATSLAGCSGSPGKQTTAAPAAGEPGAGQAAQSTATGEPIKVGVSNMVTGPMAAGGIRMKQAITMAFEEINANGGVLGGRPLEMVLVDDTGTPPGAVNADPGRERICFHWTAHFPNGICNPGTLQKGRGSFYHGSHITKASGS